MWWIFWICLRFPDPDVGWLEPASGWGWGWWRNETFNWCWGGLRGDKLTSLLMTTAWGGVGGSNLSQGQVELSGISHVRSMSLAPCSRSGWVLLITWLVRSFLLPHGGIYKPISVAFLVCILQSKSGMGKWGWEKQGIGSAPLDHDAVAPVRKKS